MTLTAPPSCLAAAAALCHQTNQTGDLAALMLHLGHILGTGHVPAHAATGVTVRIATACKTAIRAICGATVIAAAAQVSVGAGPGPVPLSLQSQAVLFVAAALGARAGTLAVALYLMAGARGLPVFAQASSGLHHLMGPRGGYLLSYVPVAAWVGWAQARSAWVRGLVCGGAALLTLAIGAAWLGAWVGPKAALELGFWPFLLVDLCKAGTAFLGLTAWRLTWMRAQAERRARWPHVG